MIEITENPVKSPTNPPTFPKNKKFMKRILDYQNRT